MNFLKKCFTVWTVDKVRTELETAVNDEVNAITASTASRERGTAMDLGNYTEELLTENFDKETAELLQGILTREEKEVMNLIEPKRTTKKPAPKKTVKKTDTDITLKSLEQKFCERIEKGMKREIIITREEVAFILRNYCAPVGFRFKNHQQNFMISLRAILQKAGFSVNACYRIPYQICNFEYIQGKLLENYATGYYGVANIGLVTILDKFIEGIITEKKPKKTNWSRKVLLGVYPIGDPFPQIFFNSLVA